MMRRHFMYVGAALAFMVITCVALAIIGMNALNEINGITAEESKTVQYE